MSDDRVTILGGKIDALELALADQVDVIKALRETKAKQQKNITELEAKIERQRVALVELMLEQSEGAA